MTDAGTTHYLCQWVGVQSPSHLPSTHLDLTSISTSPFGNHPSIMVRPSLGALLM